MENDSTFRKGVFSDYTNRRFALPVSDSLYMNRHYRRDMFRDQEYQDNGVPGVSQAQNIEPASRSKNSTVQGRGSLFLKNATKRGDNSNSPRSSALKKRFSKETICWDHGCSGVHGKRVSVRTMRCLDEDLKGRTEGWLLSKGGPQTQTSEHDSSCSP